MPSIVPWVDTALNKLGYDLPLEPNKDECHPGKPSHRGTSGNTGQTCRWHRDEIAGATSYRILSATVRPAIDLKAAQEHFEISKQSGLAPRPVALGDEATAGAVDAPHRGVTIRGQDDTLAVTGARLAVRVHNVNIDIEWLGADYTMDAHGNPTHIRGLAREKGTRQAMVIARAITMHLQ